LPQGNLQAQLKTDKETSLGELSEHRSSKGGGGGKNREKITSQKEETQGLNSACLLEETKDMLTRRRDTHRKEK